MKLSNPLPADLIWTEERACPICQSKNIATSELTRVILSAGSMPIGVMAKCRDCKKEFAIDTRLKPKHFAAMLK